MKKVLIIFGGNSFEHDVSCKSVNYIIKNIDKKIFNYKLVGINFLNEWFEIDERKIDSSWMNKNKKRIDNINSYLKNFDIVFPVIHGNSGEDGKLQAVFELNNIKYVGSDSYSSIICYDKLLTKLILEKYGIPQVEYFIYKDSIDKKKINFPVIIKPCKCGSSIGISTANNIEEMNKSIKKAKKYDNRIIIERFIKNKRELECAILENKKKIFVSDVGEIINKNTWYDYDSKYKLKTDTKISDINPKIKRKIKEYSKKIFKTLGCKNLSRIDFIFDNDNKKLYFNEINTIPGFTEISMYPKLIKNIGISPKNLITTLLNS